MPAVVDKLRIQCRYRDDQDRQCLLDALENAEYCRFRLTQQTPTQVRVRIGPALSTSPDMLRQPKHSVSGWASIKQVPAMKVRQVKYQQTTDTFFLDEHRSQEEESGRGRTG